MTDDEAPPAHGRRDRRRPVRGRADRRSVVTRLPVVLVLGAAVVGAVVVDGARDGTTGEATGTAAPRAVMPASPPPERGTSTWYCAAGTAVGDGFADHTVTIQNPTADDLTATLTVYSGDVVAPAPAGDAAAGRTSTATAGDTTTSTTTAGGTATTTSTSTTAGSTASSGAAAAAVPTEPVAEQVDLPAGTTTSVHLADLVDAPLAAALVEVDGADVAVEHRVAGPHGADVGPCSTFAAPTWHFAWGSTARDARDVVVLFNPFPSGATVDARFVTDDGGREPVRFQGFPVPPGSVVGVDVGDDVTGADEVAATFRVRSGRVVIERLEELDGSFGLEGLDLTLGSPSAGTSWVFADGEASSAGLGPPDPTTGERPRADEADSGGDDEGEEGDEADGDPADPRDDADATVTTERIVVYNPGDDRAEVDVSLVPTTDQPEPPPQPFRLTVGAGRFEVVDYGSQDRVVPGVGHATVVRSANGVPVVAERVTIDEGPEQGADDERLGELSAATGARLAATTWRLPDVGDLGGDDRTIEAVVFNPGAGRPATVRFTTLAGEVGSSVEVPPGARVAVALGPDATDATGTSDAPTGLVAESDVPVVVERVIRTADGRRVVAAPAIPAGAGVVDLDAAG